MVSGFSKLNKTQKIEWLLKNHFNNDKDIQKTLEKYLHISVNTQKLHDDFTENPISNFYLPFSVAPNFLINQKQYTVPMSIEESSVVAAASKAAKFWSERQGFEAHVEKTTKVGQVHFSCNVSYERLLFFFKNIREKLIDCCKDLTQNMEKRGGGILSIELVNKTDELENYYQLFCKFNTADAMGANFINSCLERLGENLKKFAKEQLLQTQDNLDIIMCILSNYVPECLVNTKVSCKISELTLDKNITPEKYAQKFVQALEIARIDPYRAVTHNKGIMNGIDAVVVATGNDFRAVESGVHAYASRSGQYRSLSKAWIEKDTFTFELNVPLALGTVGGLTSLHPLVKIGLQMLGNPTAKELMQIIASTGLAQNFAAVNSLITSGIQKGHMKMHLKNILNQLQATPQERISTEKHFENTTVTHAQVIAHIKEIREVKN